MRRSLLLAAGLATGLVLWFVFGSAGRDAAGDAPRPDARRTETPDPGAPLLPATEGAETLTPSGPPARAERERRTGIAAAADGFAPWPPAGVGMEVLVVEAETERPVPHAIVRYLDDVKLARTDEATFFASGFDVDGIFARYGVAYRADESGRLRVPVETGSVTLLGSARDRWALVPVRGEREPFVLRLVRDPETLVSVVDTGGRPVPDVPVALRFRFSPQNVLDVSRWRTDARGQARLRHARGLHALIEGERLVGLSGPLEPPVEVELPDDALGTQQELVLPDHGAVAVRLVSANGEPVARPAVLAVAWFRAGSPDQLRQAQLGAFENGRIRVDPVGLGLDLELWVASLQGGELAHVERFAGPRRLGEIVERAVVVEPTPVLAMRLLDPAREPLADRMVIFVRNVRTGESDSWDRDRTRLRTDASGRVRIELEGEAPQGARSWLDLQVPTESGAIAYVAARDLPSALEPDVTDIGDVVLEPAPLLASGRVVDELGVPLPGARVGVQAIADSGEDETWRSVDELTTSGDVEGRFMIRGVVDAVRLALTPWHEGYAAAEVPEVAPGTRDVVLTLQATGQVRVQVRTDEAVDASHLTVLLRSAEGEPRQYGFELDGTALLERVPVGHYSLVVFVSGESRRLHRSDVVVRPHEETRVDAIDLTGRLTQFLLSVVDAEGLPRHASVRVRSQGAEEFGEWLRTGKGGRLLLTASGAFLDLEVVSSGQRAVRLSGLVAQHTVVLEPGLPVELELEGDPGLLPGERLSVYLWHTEGGGRSVGSGWVEAGRGRALVPEPGLYGARLSFHRGDGRDAPAMQPVPSEVALEVEVTEGAQAFLLLPVDAETIQGLR